MGVRRRVADNLRLLRKAKHLTQIDLALACKLDRTSIGYIEQEYVSTSIDTLEKICKFLDIDISFLFASKLSVLNFGELCFCFLTEEGVEYYPITSNFNDSIRFLMAFFQSNGYSNDKLKNHLKKMNIPYNYHLNKC